MADKQQPFLKIASEHNLFLLARPTGGIADMLSQIGRCIAYCQRCNRYLVVDTNIQDFFAEDFSKYFEFTDTRLGITVLDEHTLNVLNNSQTHPKTIQGKLSIYEPSQIPEKIRTEISSKLGHFTNLWDRETQSSLSFDMRKEHSQTLLVHHCSGGGTENALNALNFLEPTITLKKSIENRLAVLPKYFSAIHVRNTDLKSDLEAVRKKVTEFEGSPILICSDDLKLIQQLRKEHASAELISLVEDAIYTEDVIKIPTLHKNNPKLPRHEINTDMFVELIAMAISNQFYAAPLVKNRIKKISGFSELVQALRENHSVLNKFISL